MDDGGSTLWSHFSLLLPLLLAAVGWYASSRIAVSAVASHPRAALLRAAAQIIPVFFVAITAIVRHQPQIAIGVVFGSCVATLSLVMGVVTFTAPPDRIAIDARRRWGFVLPAAMLVFLAGYQSQLTLLHALVLALEGAVVLLVWPSPRDAEARADANAPEGAKAPGGAEALREGGALVEPSLSQDAARREPRPPLKPWPLWLAPVLLAFAVAIAMVASWFAISGASNLLKNSSLPSMSIIAALLLGPALVIPMIGADSTIAQHGDYTDAVSSQVGFVLLNLCLILPLVIVAWYVQSLWPIHSAADAWARMSDVTNDSPLNFPLIVWRVDTVLLIVLGLALLPMSLGRWLPRRAEGVLLILMYAAYMVLWRWGTSMG